MIALEYDADARIPQQGVEHQDLTPIANLDSEDPAMMALQGTNDEMCCCQ